MLEVDNLNLVLGPLIMSSIDFSLAFSSSFSLMIMFIFVFMIVTSSPLVNMLDWDTTSSSSQPSISSMFLNLPDMIWHRRRWWG